MTFEEWYGTEDFEYESELASAAWMKGEASRDAEVAELRQQLAAAQAKHTALLSDFSALKGMCDIWGGEAVRVGNMLSYAFEREAITRRRNADDMGNPPANAADLLNAWKPKP